MSIVTAISTHTPLALSPPGSPASPTSASSGQLDSAGGPIRRKASRRANTAERRATHNAVERQRRETLNGRFLDLAALLPNLASVRRPSKSAIVNSSIALVHTQRRARALAGRELRLLAAETAALRRELNEWRDRAALPRVDEPPRSAEFGALMALEDALDEPGEDERRALAYADEDEIDDGDEYGGVPAHHVYAAFEPSPPPVVATQAPPPQPQQQQQAVYQPEWYMPQPQQPQQPQQFYRAPVPVPAQYAAVIEDDARSSHSSHSHSHGSASPQQQVYTPHEMDYMRLQYAHAYQQPQAHVQHKPVMMQYATLPVMM